MFVLFVVRLGYQIKTKQSNNLKKDMTICSVFLKKENWKKH